MNLSKTIMMALAAMLVCLAVAPAMAAPQQYDMNKYAGTLELRSTTSNLVAPGEFHPVFLSNDLDKNHAQYKMTLSPDGTWSEWFIPGNFTLEYGTCRIPVTIVRGERTTVSLPDCDR